MSHATTANQHFHHFSPVSPLIFSVAALAFAVTAHSEAALLWNNAAGGSASTASNWNPVQMPLASDDLTYNLAGSFIVSFNASVPTSRTHVYRNGSVTLNLTSPHTTTTGVTIGSALNDVATATLTTGTWTSNANVTLGSVFNSTGTLNVNDDDADFKLSGATTDLTVGSNGAGTMNITGGGRVVVPDQLIVGNNASSLANLTVSGFSFAPISFSTLEVNGASQSRFGQGGDATVSITNGGQALFDGDLAVAFGSASTSVVTVQGSGLTNDATLDVAGDVLLGRNTSAATAAGTATLNVNANGHLVVGETLFVAGDPDGGSATLHVADGGLVSTTNMNIGTGATLDLDGGAIDIDGGVLSFTNTGGQFNLSGANNPVLTMINGATANLGPTFPLSGVSLIVGGGSGPKSGDFDVRSGSDLTLFGAVPTVMGDGVDDHGGMRINGVGSTMTLGNNCTLIVGNNGVGRFEVELGGSATGDRLIIGHNVNSNGAMLIETVGSTATFDDVYVGGSNFAQGGVGDLMVNASSEMHANSVKVWPTGALLVSLNAALNVANGINSDGLVQLQDAGIINASTISIGDSLNAVSGPQPNQVNAAALVAATATVEATTGDLIIGSLASTSGFNMIHPSNLIVGANAVTLHDADNAQVSMVTIAGGTLAAPNGLQLVNNGTIDGTGTINASEVFFNSGGSIITATGANGITFNGRLRNNSGNIDGTKYTFNGPNGGWTGAGAIDAQVVFNSGTKIDALANMTIGANNNFGVTFNAGSELDVNDEIVTLVDANGLGLPTITNINDGTLICTQPLTANNGRTVRGRGDINTPLLSVLGNLRPGDVDGNENIGVIDVNGNIALGVNSNTLMHIAGDPVIARSGGSGGDGGLQPFDIIFANDISLNGTMEVRLLNGYSPAVGTEFIVIDGANLVNTFASLLLQRPGPGKNWLIQYDQPQARVRLIVNTCIADLSHNGEIDVSDLIAVIVAWDAVGDNHADINGDGIVDVSDLLAVITSWGACP